MSTTHRTPLIIGLCVGGFVVLVAALTVIMLMASRLSLASEVAQMKSQTQTADYERQAQFSGSN